MKKKWVRPNLIVLVRGKMEERVLENCKTELNGGIGAIAVHSGCRVITSCALSCNVYVDS